MCARVQNNERHAYWRHIGNLILIGDAEKDLNYGKQRGSVIHKIPQDLQLRSLHLV